MKPHRIRTLLIEDNHGDARLVREVLRETPEIDIHTVDRISLGVEYLISNQVDVVLLDLGLPDSQGLDSLRAVQDAAPNMTIVVLTGQDDEAVGRTAIRQGAQDYIVKPVVIGRTLARILSFAVERKLLEDALRDARYRAEWLARFPEENPNPVMRASADGSVLYCNPASLKKHGWACRNGERLPDPVFPLFVQALTEEQGIQQDVELGERYYSVTVEPILGKSYANVYGIDITERKLAEEKIRKYSTELTEKNEELRAMTQQLWQSEKLATMGELSASIAHELNNPLATVSLRVESLLEKIPKDNSNRRELVIIEQEVERMGVLVANLLQFSRRGQPQISMVDVCEEIEKTLDLIYYHLRNHNISIMRQFAHDVPKVQADRQQLRQLFLNLFTNAIDAMPSGGMLTIVAAADAEGKKIRIEIADTGTGISQEILSKVMEPFYSTKPEGKGTGLGLAICRRVAETHKGTIEITSDATLGKGTRVSLTLPVSDSSTVDYLCK